MNPAGHYWTNLYRDNMDACVVRVYQSSYDFLAAARRVSGIYDVLTNAKSMIEVGCGTGDMGRLMKLVNPTMDYYGIDISESAIQYAKDHYKTWGMSFQVKDLFAVNERFDVAFCSNTLEHFKDPYRIIDRMLVLADVVIAVVPYNQELNDGYDVEGGAGHVFSFTEDSFRPYKVIGSTKYFTHTWVVGENPLQLAIAFRR